MQSVSSKWLPALATDHGLSVKVNALYNGATLAEDIPFTDGTVKVDRGSDVRRSLSLTVPDPAQFPVSPTDRFAVYGQRLYVEAGIRYLDGSIERVPVGMFIITSVSGNIHTGPLSIQASGLELLLKRALWDSATSTKGYANAAAFLAYHIPNAIGADFVDSSTRGTTALATKTWDANTDLWTAFREVADSVGCELFCDANGTFRLADIPDPLNAAVTPIWDVSTGDHGVMVSATMELSADGVYNRVIVTGENAADNKPAVRGTATITDANDPLRYGGPFGKVTKAYSSSLVTTSTQATATANALLAKYRAPNRRVTLETVPNAALDAGDYIRVNYGTAHLPEIHAVHSFDIPLSVSGGGFTINTVSGKEDDA
ncbi:tail protein [Streptomyces phage Rowa]|uniref:Minor tail protein n=1 Tax=Streptomyces phage Rowa TaxID=2059883 RepID=A0A2H5BLU7_9CAUD|nr:tail protein [Streptomyces phage Rowa]AUG87282.1 minor tail protein [Streptomyces phage Rowa]